MIKLTLDENFDFSGTAYSGLFAASNATAFQHPDWLNKAAETLAKPKNADMMTIIGWSEDNGELVLVIPFVRRYFAGVSLLEAADFGVTDYAAPVVRNGHEKHIIRQSGIGARICELVGHCDIFRIKSARAEHVDLWQALTGLDMQRADFSSHAVRLGEPYADWRKQAFGKSHCKYLDRKNRKLEKSGKVEFRNITDPAEAGEAIRELAALRAGRFDSDPIQQDAVCDFYAEMARDGAESGFTRTYRFSLDGETMAIVFGTVHDCAYNYLLIGGDYDRFANHSPGLLIYDRIMEDWLKAGGTHFDFTVGDEPFKMKFGTSPTAIYSLTKARTTAGRFALAAQSAKQKIVALRRRISAPPLAPAAIPKVKEKA